MPLRICSTRVATAEVRATEAASGSCTATKNAPWSSSGRKPVGVVRAANTMPTANTAIATSDSAANRTTRCTTQA